MVHQPVSRGFAVFADAWLSGWLGGDQRQFTGSGSALGVVLHDYALYKSTFTLLYYIVRTMLPQDVCPSVRPSHAGILSKQLNISKLFLTIGY